MEIANQTLGTFCARLNVPVATVVLMAFESEASELSEMSVAEFCEATEMETTDLVVKCLELDMAEEPAAKLNGAPRRKQHGAPKNKRKKSGAVPKPADDEDVDLGAVAKEAVKGLKKNKELPDWWSVAEMREALDLDTDEGKMVLAALVAAKALKRKGKARGTRYRLK